MVVNLRNSLPQKIMEAFKEEVDFFFLNDWWFKCDGHRRGLGRSALIILTNELLEGPTFAPMLLCYTLSVLHSSISLLRYLAASFSHPRLFRQHRCVTTSLCDILPPTCSQDQQLFSQRCRCSRTCLFLPIASTLIVWNSLKWLNTSEWVGVPGELHTPWTCAMSRQQDRLIFEWITDRTPSTWKEGNCQGTVAFWASDCSRFQQSRNLKKDW